MRVRQMPLRDSCSITAPRRLMRSLRATCQQSCGVIGRSAHGLERAHHHHLPARVTAVANGASLDTDSIDHLCCYTCQFTEVLLLAESEQGTYKQHVRKAVNPDLASLGNK
nr:hypothetical protein CFP56_31501 [Quercus suber]